MNTPLRLSLAGLMVCGLYSCSMFDEDPAYHYENYGYDQSVYYPHGTKPAKVQVQSNNVASGTNVVSPSSPAAVQVRAPVAHQQQDKDWVNKQNPMGYTIQVGDDANASSVANKLMQAPKDDHTAQIKYQSGGQTHYKGLYGSYQNMDAAKKAYDALPQDVKSNASIKSWSNVQGSVNE